MGGVAAIAKTVFKPQSKPAPAPTPVTPTPVTPTQAEVSQSAATDAEGLTKIQKARRRGRSATILTSTSGVEGDTTLGTKSLLGG